MQDWGKTQFSCDNEKYLEYSLLNFIFLQFQQSSWLNYLITDSIDVHGTWVMLYGNMKIATKISR